ncbi:putative manganese transport protein MntH [Paenibacillus larvae subsp. larvae]|uniref:Divalent metal cation transporter MntH n=1 Tax=Paenibacillus larvae subsp. larvae TaxID=147375 RepID=A0A2L1UE95_9BACL|nr:Nramp family divalent metal transporter [Paenibacillus larvae]AQZ48482.1 divalent metal cation transporter [Paenibacillus larvae subsp. pulvifaciens]AVF26494.1 putative manganese transport protein MntH [Paenibacillus larvae subsp. larvae]AVF31270.1 putative manganese transport protein MntH [Paenibacillus larvae subsp. larvae]MBH0341416.1 manganese transporter [Paenibacillus larvae]MCY7521853.1 Nramp family divalent metal transporter [Paenibacillus larvae]
MHSQLEQNKEHSGWLRRSSNISLEEVNNSVKVPGNAGFWRKFFAFAGPGSLVAVGYVDPGNWATSIAGGARFGYTLLFVILVSNLIAMLLQSLSAKLGIVTGRDLAQATRDAVGKKSAIVLWILTELAIIATDLAEVIGSAIALNLLFGIPLLFGILITTVDVLLLLLLQKKGFRIIESIVIVLMATIFFVFVFEVIISKPQVSALLGGYLPKAEIITNPDMLFISLGILGATVMPHNLYLHSSIVQTRQYKRTREGRKEAVKFTVLDSTLSLTLAFFVNSAILILGAAAFFGTGLDVSEIEGAYELLSPTLGVGIASTLFAVALLASGQNSTITGTLTGQIVMEGFVNLRITPWLRRMITRLIAVVPAFIVTWIAGSKGTGELLLWSQVVLSLQLPFAVIPLVLFTSDKRKMGEFTNPMWIKVLAWVSTAVIVALNVFLVGYILLTGQDLG